MKTVNWCNAQNLSSDLADLGWRTPDTYSSEFGEVGDFPAVYLFQVYDQDTFTRGIIAYVGKSICVAKRWSGHEILRQLDHPKYWVKRWYLPTSSENLSAQEFYYIRKFDPPWNIQGRVRGVCLT